MYVVKSIVRIEKSTVDKDGNADDEEYWTSRFKDDDSGETVALKSNKPFSFSVGDEVDLVVKSHQSKLEPKKALAKKEIKV